MSDSDRSNKFHKNRFKFMTKIREAMPENTNTFLVPPKEHWLNPDLFILNPKFEEQQKENKNPSWLTIISIWNVMIGSSIVSLPANVRDAGIIPTIGNFFIVNFLVLVLLFFFICWYTCNVVVKTGGKDNDYSDTVERYLGPKYGKAGKFLQILFSILINVGALYIYFLIINQHFFPVLVQLFGLDVAEEDMLKIDFSRFSIAYSSIIVCFLLLPLIIKKDINFIIKINTLGVYSMILIISFVFYTFFTSLFNTTYDFQYLENEKDSELRHLQLFGSDISKLCGMLPLGFFSHSIILPILKNNRYQENNKRDVFLGYLMVALSYILMGISGYVGFSGYSYDPNLFGSNWFYLCDSKSWYIIILRIMSFCQLSSIFPLIAYVIRIQFFGTFFKSNYPSFLHIFIFAIVAIITCFLVLILFIDNLAKFIGFIGAGTGLFLIYIIPLLVNAIYYKIKHPVSRLTSKLRNEEKENINEIITEDSNEISNENEGEYFGSDFGLGVSEKKPNKFKDNFVYFFHGFLIIFGVFTLVLQFYQINFFDIELK